MKSGNPSRRVRSPALASLVAAAAVALAACGGGGSPQVSQSDEAVEYALSKLDAPFPELELNGKGEPAILFRAEATPAAPALTIRAGGDRYLLLEYGPNVLDMNLRFRAHALMQGLHHLHLPGVIDITPGIRSLHIHYDSRRLPREHLLEALETAESVLPVLDEVQEVVPVEHCQVVVPGVELQTCSTHCQSNEQSALIEPLAQVSGWQPL